MQDINLTEIKTQNRQHGTIIGVPHPFLKWVGGKRYLLNQIDVFIPNDFDTYIEPFLGGGALFFYLLPKKAVLIDNNPDLINAYQVIKENVEDLIRSLKKHKNKKEYFYKIRSVDRNLEEYNKWSDVEKASRTIYLNRCCYNGLYRVNKKGQFNTPFGKYKNPTFCDRENLLTVHKVLQEVEIILGSFESCLKHAEKGDFVYFDPPYHPLSDTANFTSYTKENFGKHSQEKILNIFKTLDERGCKLMLSNSYNEFILELYHEYHMEIVKAKRSINSDPSKRGEIRELLIFNY